MYQPWRLRLMGYVSILLGAVFLVLSLTNPADSAPITTPVAQPIPVTVVDNTHGQWAGVQDAVDGWNRSPLVHLTMADACTPGVRCVVVDAANYGPRPWLGQAWPATTYRVHRVELNTHNPPNWWQQTAAVCHELGHVLGVDHPTGSEDPLTWGCIAAPDPRHITHVASDADLAKLAAALS